ncbi:HTTM domain-containing protein [Chitinophaga pendula]|uniref:HTTM domain-containing protein n=1 Tax=Chitinophaga TaxID=79328 RepID=UPI000BB0A14F|nr:MULTISPECIES: HTTM domain-containing protein [Chitinophaga]ASZ13872.1 hypothetical protein CK934_24405 [Chitinophaga sp. MD30]UCJ08507.1 HTTM domain-containing protein [Chitinophaga pendula]
MQDKSPSSHAGWLFFFRVNIAGFALLHFLAIQPDFTALYSYKGYIYPDIMDTTTDYVSPTVVSLQAFLQRMDLPTDYESLLLVCRIAYPLALILLILGLFTRISAVLSLLFQLLLIKSIHLYEYGIDGYTTFALFYCCVFPVGAVYSLDNRRRRSRRQPDHLPYLFLLRGHLGVAYFFSGFDKVIGVTWRNGEALWKALHSHNYYSMFSLDFLVDTPFFVISGWATIILEICYGLFMNLRSTRRYSLAGIILLHVFIACFMGLFFFSALLILLNLSAYYAPYISYKNSNTLMYSEVPSK